MAVHQLPVWLVVRAEVVEHPAFVVRSVHDSSFADRANEQGVGENGGVSVALDAGLQDFVLDLAGGTAEGASMDGDLAQMEIQTIDALG